MENRIIKFRAWDGERMLRVDALYLADNASAWGAGILDEHNDFHADIQLVQFTGLLDKAGVEIYEGDIVQIDGTAWRVKWNYGAFIVTAIGNRAVAWPLHQFRVPEQLEVIGNVFEQPDLVK